MRYGGLADDASRYIGDFCSKVSGEATFQPCGNVIHRTEFRARIASASFELKPRRMGETSGASVR